MYKAPLMPQILGKLTIKHIGVGSCSKLRGGGATEVIRTHLYGEKLHSYGVIVKTGGA